jgi:hypothetical protein
METDNTYGWGTSGDGIDTHLIKNVEWGAVAYLTESVYGKNAEVWINNSSAYTTGCAGAGASAASGTACDNTYETTNGVQASTTGNIYGVYDMSGGAWEYTSSYVDSAPANLTGGSNIVSTDKKYRDVYSVASIDSDANNYALALSHKGDALYETSATGTGSTAWHGDSTNMPRTDYSWFRRGGYNSNVANAGLFNFTNIYGGTNSAGSFRSTILVSPGL